MPDCWPPCSPWCSCNTANGRCEPRPVSLNAVRLRTPDGRYLQSPATGTLLLASRVAQPGFAETFLLAPGSTGRPASGGLIELRACDANHAPSGAQVRADHALRTLPRSGKNAPPLVTYEIGGPGQAMRVSGPLPAGYPAYRGDDPAEWRFRIVKAGPGPIVDGDTVSLRIDSNLGSTFFFRVAGPQSGAGVNADGTALGAPGTSFIVTFGEVQAGAGWRPPVVACRSCAQVVGTVVSEDGGAPVAGARVEALDVPENHPFSGLSGADGRFALADPEGRDCIPAGPRRLRATCDRFQPLTQGPLQVPASGRLDIELELACTVLSGTVIDQVGRPLAGVAIALVDPGSRAPVLAPDGQPYTGSSGIDGRFVFRCVPHGALAAWTSTEPQRLHLIEVPPEGTDVTIPTQTVCGNIVGRVRHARTLAPVAMARVAVGGQGLVQTSASGAFLMPCVRPAGSYQLLVTAPGFQPGSGFALAPTQGDSALVDILLQPLPVNSIAIRLDWGALPADLDLRVTGPDNQGGRFQIVFAIPMPVPHASLDRDATMGFGPETVTLLRLSSGSFVPGLYRVWVLNVTALQQGATYGGSLAGVTVLQQGAGFAVPQGRFDVAQAAGPQDASVWHPCDLDLQADGTVTVIPVQVLDPAGPAVIQ